MRDHNQEYQDSANRQYAYDFDYRMHDYLLRTFSLCLPKGSVLELGCYKGEFTKLLTQYYSDITVIDAASDLIAVAKTVVPNSVNFIHSTFESANVNKQFDAIFLIHTLEHLDDPLTVLKKIRESWLSDSGLLFLVTPNAHAASRQIAVNMGLITHNAAVTEGEASHGHRCTYTLDTLARDAKSAGLKVRQQGGVFFKPFANFQLDKLLQAKIIDEAYLEGCYQLGMRYPDLCASIYCICEK